MLTRLTLLTLAKITPRTARACPKDVAIAPSPQRRVLAAVALTVIGLLIGPYSLATAAPVRTLAPSEVKAIEAFLPCLSLEDKVGQVLVVGTSGLVPDSHLRRFIALRSPGGVFLGPRNAFSADQVRALIESTQRLAGSSGAGIPLLVAVDEEGGVFRPLNRVLPPLPGPRDIAISPNSVALARGYAEQNGKALAGLGISWNFAPLADVVSDPRSFLFKRTFSGWSTPTVGLAQATVDGYQSRGVLATLKHFPGHGAAVADSHSWLPVVKMARRPFSNTHIWPFRALINSERPPVAVMTGHLRVLDIDAILPASLSTKLTTDVLREDLGFAGLVVTDSLLMGAITKNYFLDEASVLALGAGADMLLLATSEAGHEPAYQAIFNAVVGGVVPQSRLDAAVRNVLIAKARTGVKRWTPMRSCGTPDRSYYPEDLAVQQSPLP